MRFGDLRGHTRLPVEHVEHRFRYEDVITVLPTRSSTGRDTILVATPPKLAVVAGAPLTEGHWMTYWAPWDTVRIMDDEATDDGWYGLTLNIGRLVVAAWLPGAHGQRALRDFVIAIQDRQSAPAASPTAQPVLSPRRHDTPDDPARVDTTPPTILPG